jgi:hypothetical protein
MRWGGVKSDQRLMQLDRFKAALLTVGTRPNEEMCPYNLSVRWHRVSGLRNRKWHRVGINYE